MINREAFVESFRVYRQRSRELFDLVTDEAYFTRPIPLRNPVVFYEGHLPGFAVNTLVKAALHRSGIDEGLETLFARGIDPADEASIQKSDPSPWPSRMETRAYADRAYELVGDALISGDIAVAGDPMLQGAAAVHTILEHELMHQETLLYMLHRLPHEQKRRPADLPAQILSTAPAGGRVHVPQGSVTLGSARDAIPFGWDNEFPSMRVEVASFEVDADDVTNREFLEFVEGGGYADRRLWDADAWKWLLREHLSHPLFWERHRGEWVWRGMFEFIELPDSWPVFVSQAEASAYARWKGRRLMTEAEFHRAAYGTPGGEERSFPWGEDPPDSYRGNFDFQRYEPVAVGTYPEGSSAWGVRDLLGNGWEWTSTVFKPFPGFTPMATYPQYSADFFDEDHFVMKGGSPVTAAPLLRRSFRNWFRPSYPYVYATFRCANIV